MEERVYAPIGEGKAGFGLLIDVFQQTIKAHSLGFRLAERNIKAKYRQSILGLLWAFLPALATSVIWIFLHSSRIVQLADTGLPYPVFVISGTILWQIFSQSILAPMAAVQTNKSILVKVNFPREAIIISSFYEVLLNGFISIAVGTILLLIFGVYPGFSVLFFLPVLLLLMLFGLGIGLVLLPIGTLFKDIQFGLPSLLQIIMYLTPVVYAQPLFSGMAAIMKYNPVTPVLNASRASWTGGALEEYGNELLLVGIITFVLITLGLLVQRLVMEILVERMGS